MSKTAYTLTAETTAGTFTKNSNIAFGFCGVARNTRFGALVYWSRGEAGAAKLAAYAKDSDGYEFVGVFPVTAEAR